MHSTSFGSDSILPLASAAMHANAVSRPASLGRALPRYGWPVVAEGARGAVRRSLSQAPAGPVERGRWMDLLERDTGDFRIYAGAIDAVGGGYTAAVEVHQVRGVAGAPEVVFSSDRISGGHRFEETASALRHALDIGHQAIRLRASLDS